MQGFGILAGGIVTLIISSAFRAGFHEPAYQDDRVASTGTEADFVWRIILMLGALPALLTYYWRMKMPETARYTALVAKNAKLAAADMSKVLQVELEDETEKMDEMVSRGANDFGLFSPQFARRHGLHLVGTATTWFLLDIAFYSQNLFQKDIFTSINWIPKARTMSALDEVFRISRAQTLIALCGTVPGYCQNLFQKDIFTSINWIPKARTMSALDEVFRISRAQTLIALCGTVPGYWLRSTCHGISAAAGKAGAMIGAFGFLYAAQDPHKPDAGYRPGIGVRNSLFVLAGVNLLGFMFTFLVPEANGKSLEEMSGEAQDNEDQARAAAVQPSTA
ncbi:putative inorganic phosphate transporter 1-8 [Triticum urartu]|uniref:H(+)/Pi cotransporter n=1 Tax=Triticum urartu TaxID=4572 RepID=M7ZTD0_TRIUA|nr:putative inorganic phosphate transporter 1-8 [Triticum urartu]